MTRFQIILTTILIIAAVVGVAMFALSKNSGSSTATEVILWGTFDASIMDRFLSDVAIDNKREVNVSYVEKNPATFESELIEALARRTGPDLILLPHDLIIKQLDKFYIVPFSSYSERLFRDTFVELGELYIVPNTDRGDGGVVGFPFSIDPMVMYWNRDLFADAGVASPPRTWTEFSLLVPKLTKKDASGSILASTVAFGEVRNVDHAKDILSLLAIQAGTSIVMRDSIGNLSSVLSMSSGSLSPGEEAVRFFTEFANPVKSSYSWNRSLPRARASFLAGRLAIYFGYASELSSLRASNPNLNFDVAEVPQTGSRRITFGRMHALAILNSSQNISPAFLAATTLTSSPVIEQWVGETNLPPVRRDLLSRVPSDAYRAVMYQGALSARAWLDPNRDGTDAIFTRLVENVTSGRLLISEAVRTASFEIDGLIRR